jgi:hypothetical protein
MKCSGQHLFTPVYLKLTDAMPWPDQESAFHLLSQDGLFLCRNTPFFKSCVPVQAFPSELAGQEPFLHLTCPCIPRRLMEQVVVFFDQIGERHASEAAVLIAWNRVTHAVEIIVPDQVGFVGTTWRGEPFPIDLEYAIPSLPPGLALLGDIHSHVDGPAYASCTDKSDEAHRPGLHLVVGRIFEEPPQFHCEATTDGFRFKIHDLSPILEGYHRRRVNEVPSEWIGRVTVRPWSTKHRSVAFDQTRPPTSNGSNSGRPGSPCFGKTTAQRADAEAGESTPGDKSEEARDSVPNPISPPEPRGNNLSDAGDSKLHPSDLSGRSPTV